MIGSLLSSQAHVDIWPRLWFRENPIDIEVTRRTSKSSVPAVASVAITEMAFDRDCEPFPLFSPLIQIFGSWG